MRLVKYFMPILIVAGFQVANVSAQVNRQETGFDRELNTRDDQPLREFVESKENIDVKEKASNLEISGDVRFEWRSIREKGVVFFFDEYGSYVPEGYSPELYEEYRALRGGRHVNPRGVPISLNDFDVEFNLKLKYNFKRAWCFAHLQFDNAAGVRGRDDCFLPAGYPVFNRRGDKVVGTLSRNSRWTIKGSGTANNITLKRAFMGYNIWADGKHRLDIEIGRRKLEDVFDSEIEFTSRFDGVLLKYASSIGEFSDWYLDGGVFVIDENTNHFGWVAEVGLLDILDSGLDLRYNIIDWRKRGENRCFVSNPLGARFLNSQVTITYTIHPKFGWFRCGKEELPVEFYGGFLVNHLARGSRFTHHKKKNLGWYAGVYIGSVHKEGDWSFDLEYVVVQAQAVPEYDVGSIGRGNILDENSLDLVNVPDTYSYSYASEDDVKGIFPRRGNSNFVGYRIEFLYGITDNFSIDFVYEMSNEEDRRIGGRHSYNDFEIEAIYAF